VLLATENWPDADLDLTLTDSTDEASTATADSTPAAPESVSPGAPA